MKYLFAPALLGLIMTGCTSSEPQGLVAAAPSSETVMPAPAAPSFTGSSASMPIYGQQAASPIPAPTTTVTPAQTTTSAGFPAPPACGPGTECAARARMEKCRTVGSVTTCDVPPDPSADNTRYTN